MKSICIKTTSKEKIDFLIRHFEKLPMNIYLSNYRFKVYDNVILHYPGEEINIFYEAVGEIIKQCIEYYYEEDFIKKEIKNNYFYLDDIEQEYILKITKKILNLPDDKIGYKNKILKKIIINYLKENKAIILEGFVNFRIKDYKQVLDNIVEVSVFSYLDFTCF
mgnify:CR=1 FL=1